MPHIVIEYAQDLSNTVTATELMAAAHQGAVDSGVFPIEDDIKTRAIFYSDYRVGQTTHNFVHVRVHLLSGRTDAHKSELTQAILKRVRTVAIQADVITVEAVDMNRACYAKDVSNHKH